MPWQRSVAAAVALAITGATAPSLVHAQSTTVGTVFGSVEAGSGDSVTVKNTATGVERTTAIGSNGRFNSTALPPGHYMVTLQKAGATVSTLELDVLAGRGTEAVFGNQLEEVVVTATASAIDVSSTVNSTVFDTAQLAELPIPNRDLNGIMNLASNTVKADSRYDGGISIGGGGPSENAYYINGFPVTNPLTQLGSTELPFDAIQQAQVQSGGFGAEFGRSVGGVVNIITKSGGAEWHGGVQIAYEPDFLRASEHTIHYDKTGSFPTTDGTLYRYTKDNSLERITYSAEVGGPLIKDRLFFYGAGDFTDTDEDTVNAARGSSANLKTGWKESSVQNKRYLAKLDWYITDNHRLEATFLGDNYYSKDDFFGFDYASLKPTAYSYTERAKNLGGVTPGVGADVQILRYVGNFTDNLTVTAMYGQSKFEHRDTYSPDNLVSSPQVRFSTTTASQFIDPRLTNPATQQVLNPLVVGTTGIADGAHEETKSYRLDVAWRLSDHLIRAGLDVNELSSVGAGEAILSPQTADTVIPPGISGTWFAYISSTRADAGTRLNIYGGQTRSLASTGATPNGTRWYYVRAREFGDITDADSNQSAQYIEDRWQMTDNFLMTVGLRNESFYNKNGNGEKFLKMDSFLSPRLSAAWDVNGDSSMKVFGSLGRYSLQVPTHISVRGASASVLVDRYYAYTGVNPTTGAPTGLTPLGTWFSGNNEYGQDKDPLSVSGKDMKPTFQDEATLGMEMRVLPDYVGGVTMTYRTLKASMDDNCDYRVIEKVDAARTDVDMGTAGSPKADFYPFGCATINVGKGNTLFFDPDGPNNDDGGVNEGPVEFNISAEDWGLSKPKREYFAVDLFLEHPFKDNWYGKLSYTWSSSKGNTEGQTKSDNGQSDVAVTSTWDFPELMEYSDGPLPNDRTHQIKAYGYYQLTPEFSVGGSVVAESGRPKNCFGTYNGAGEDIYGGYQWFFYCGGVPSPRGSAGRLPWGYNLDLSATYKPHFLEGLLLRVDAFNVTNTQTTLSVDESHDDTSGNLPTYGRTLSYSNPRSFRFTVGYTF